MPRCLKDIDDEIHLFTKCQKLNELRKKYTINDYYEMFDERLTKERMVEIVNFIKETEIEIQITK